MKRKTEFLPSSTKVHVPQFRLPLLSLLSDLILHATKSFSTRKQPSPEPDDSLTMGQTWVTRSYAQEVKLKYSSRILSSPGKNRLFQHLPIRDRCWILYACYAVLRENMTALVLGLGLRKESLFFQFDLVAALFSLNTGFNAYFFLAFGSLAVYYFYALVSLQYSNMLDRVIASALRQMVVGSWADFWRWNPQFRFALSWNLAKNWATLRKLLGALKSSGTIRFGQHQVRFEEEDHHTGDGGDGRGGDDTCGFLVYLNDRQRLKILLTMLMGEVNQALIVSTCGKLRFLQFSFYI